MKKGLLASILFIFWFAVLNAFAVAENIHNKVIGFTLINADNDLDIADIRDGDVINLAELPSRNINIIAKIHPDSLPLEIGSIVFKLNGYKTIENTIPYSLKGDDLGNYNAWTPDEGDYELVATPFTEAYGKGTPGENFTINIKVIDRPLNLPKAVYRINTGGSDYITPEGLVFEADNYSFSSKSKYRNNSVADIKDTDADELYLTESISNKDLGQLYYYLPVQPGNYTVKLHFAEIYFGVDKSEVNNKPVGKRIFDVVIDGEEKLINFDIAAEAGGATAIVKTFEVNSNEGYMIIGFLGKVNRPKISAIEVLALPTPNNPPVADAGENIAIKLPENRTTLVGSWSDTDGHVTDVQWTQVSGPAANMQGTTSSNLELSDLEAGTYFFKLTVTDNQGAMHSDDVALVVLAAEIFEIAAHPNPVTDILTITSNTNLGAPLNIRLYNKFGELSYEKLNVIPEHNNSEVNIAALTPDIYLLQVESNGVIEQVRIVKH